MTNLDIFFKNFAKNAQNEIVKFSYNEFQATESLILL
jgi:hypothetical protein